MSELLSLKQFHVFVGTEYLPGDVLLMRGWKKLDGWRSVVVGFDCFEGSSERWSSMLHDVFVAARKLV